MMIYTDKHNLHLEITNAVIRGGPGMAEPVPWYWGSTDYDIVVPLVGTEGMAILKGLKHPFSHALHDAFDQLLTAHEFHSYARHRHVVGPDGKPRAGEQFRVFPLRGSRVVD